MLTDKVFAKMKEMAGELITRHIDNMQLSYAKSDEGKLVVSLSLAVAPSKKAGELEVDASISYVVEKAKEKITCMVNENQLDLPLNGTVNVDKKYTLKK
jgi:hypothetical protein